MATRGTLDGFLERLFQDDRILSAQERALLTNLLQQVQKSAGGDRHTLAAVRETIARAVGETVSQRAFAVLGSQILQQIERDSGQVAMEEANTSYFAGPSPPSKQPVAPAPPPTQPGPAPPSQSPTGVYANAGQLMSPSPGPPSPGPSPPSQPQPAPTKPGPSPPSTSPTGVYANAGHLMSPSPGPPSPGPSPPSQPSPGPAPPSPSPRPSPSGVYATGSSTANDLPAATAVAAPPAEFLAADCVVFDEFLAPQELQQLTRYTLEHEAEFAISEVVSPGVPGASTVDYEHRKSRLLVDLGPFRQMMVDRLEACLPRVAQKLGLEVFPVSQLEAQITASNHGDFFRQHNDNSREVSIVSRELTFVYFFHREPNPFQGGELRLYDSRWIGDQYQSTGSGRNIVPQQNRIVFFRSSLMHEILPVDCPTRAFADSRFTVNGWFHK